eukprot:10896995-Alexandrium_andersonii.AAC.1
MPALPAVSCAGGLPPPDPPEPLKKRTRQAPEALFEGSGGAVVPWGAAGGPAGGSLPGTRRKLQEPLVPLCCYPFGPG